MFFLVVLHALAAAAAMAAGRRSARWAFAAAGVAPAASLAWAVAQLGPVRDGDLPTASLTWSETLGLRLDLRLDPMSLVMLLLVAGVGVLVHVYAAWYLPADRPDVARFAATLVLFAGAMTGLVLADDVLTLFVFWELTSVASYGLISWDEDRAAARSAATQALLTTGLGGLALLGGMVLLSQEAGTSSLSGILADPPTSGPAHAGYLLVLLAAATKSAQVPFHAWLPGAMAAPTPVSAYLHSATMVKAGVYVVARFSPAIVGLVGWWRPAVVALGLTTAVVGAWRSLRQTDLKLVLAYSTVSKLGLLVACFGVGTSDAVLAGVVFLVSHALFKAALFMVVGVIDHETHCRDLRRLTGVGRAFPVLAAASAVAAASMAGLPPTLGFIGKEKLYDAFVHWHGVAAGVATAVVVAASVLGFAYAWRFWWGAFGTRRQEPPEGLGLVHPPHHRVPAALLFPIVLLAAVSLVTGVAPALVSGLLARAAGALDAAAGKKDVVLWAGATTAFWLSVLTVVAGVLLCRWAARVETFQAAVGHTVPLSAQRAYEHTLTGVLGAAKRLTGVVQHGSLPVYLAVIVLTVLAVPSWWFLVRQGLPDDLTFARTAAEVVVGAVAVAAALMCVRARRRFTAVIALGATGYAVGGLFVLAGGPDLALTQVLVETLSVTGFVVVLRLLPDRFTLGGVRRPWRAGVAVAAGVITAGIVLVAGGVRTNTPPSAQLSERALTDAGGKNIVNVILVDVRAGDTLAEIAVLAVAVLGASGLVLASRRGRARSGPGEGS